MSGLLGCHTMGLEKSLPFSKYDPKYVAHIEPSGDNLKTWCSGKSETLWS
jgi:hypothetical protein